jgi:hypothetical protein
MASKVQFSPHDHLRNRMLTSLGLTGIAYVPPLNQLRYMQWDHEFEYGMRAELRACPLLKRIGITPSIETMIKLMRNRFIQGAFRYTPIPEQVKVRTDYDQCGEILRRWNRYMEKKNQEMLIDAANFCLSSHKVGWFPMPSDVRSKGMIFQLERKNFQGKRSLGYVNRVISMEHKHFEETGSKQSLYQMASIFALEWHFERNGTHFHSHDGDDEHAIHMQTM